MENPWKTFVFAVVGTYCFSKFSVWGFARVRKIQRTKKLQDARKEYEKDVVYLYSFPREISKMVPNECPFAMKVESWLRLHNIPYEFIPTFEKSATTGQMPYIVFNDDEIAESSLIIKLLSIHFGVDLTEGLSMEQLGMARAVCKMADEHTSWTYILPRYCYTPNLYYPKCISVDIKAEELDAYALQRARMHGIGRHPPEVVEEFAREDLLAISRYLGEKTFFFGDDLTLTDCTLFGHLSQVYFVDFPFSHKKVMEEECTNISPYLDRIRDILWPDWNTLVAQ